MTDVEPMPEPKMVSEEPPATEPEAVVLSETDSVGYREEGDGEEEVIPGKSLDDDLDRRNPQYIPKGGAFYEHDNRTLDTEEAEDQAENEKKKKVWKESKTTERWLHDCYVEDEQSPKSSQELTDIYGYDIRNEENAPRARRRRKYGRGPDKYERKWDDEQAYIASQKPGRGRGSGRRRGEEFPPLPNQNGDQPEREPVANEAGRGQSLGGNTPWRGAPKNNEPRQETRGEHRGGHRGPPPQRPSPGYSDQDPSGVSKTPSQARPRMEDHIKPFRHDGSSQRAQESNIPQRSRPIDGRPPTSANTSKDTHDLTQSMANMSMQQKTKQRDPRKESAQEPLKHQPAESPANRQNPKRYSKIRKGFTGYFPPEDCPDLDPREAKVALEMQAATAQNRPMPHLPQQQRQQDILVQSVNVMQRYPDGYNGNPAYLPGRTILQPIPQPGLSPQGPIPQTLSPQLAGIEMSPQPGFVPSPLFIDMGQGEVLPFQGYTAYPQGQSTDMYQASSGITYYSPEIQTGTGQPRALPQRRKAAIPIVPPPETH